MSEKRSGSPTVGALDVVLDHAGTSVADLDRSVSFYREAFGFEVEERFAIPNTAVTGVVLIHPLGARLELFHHADSVAGAPGHPIESTRERGWFQTAFRVNDAVAAFDRVVAAGATPVKAPFTAPDGRSTVAFVGDVDGNLIELIQRSHG